MSEEISKLCLAGAGLTGASVAAGLKARAPATYIVAVDQRLSGGSDTRLDGKYRALRERGWVDAVTADLSSALEGADALLLALPLSAYTSYLNSFRPSADLLITDVGSAKQCVFDFARQVWGQLPSGLVPAHPMAGRAASGHEHADERLYQKSTVFITPHADSADWAIARATALWRRLGARHIEFIGAEAHDRLLGFSSHLPQLLAYVLAHAVCVRRDDPGFAGACGPGLRDSTRLAASDARLWRDIFCYNAAHAVEAVDVFTDQLNRLRQSICDGDFDALENHFAQARIDRQIIEKAHQRRAERSASPVQAKEADR